ncbi:MAG: hypothetical protein ACFUZC_21300 [Chthoniobacteraceae bacterium]
MTAKLLKEAAKPYKSETSPHKPTQNVEQAQAEPPGGIDKNTEPLAHAAPAAVPEQADPDEKARAASDEILAIFRSVEAKKLELEMKQKTAWGGIIQNIVDSAGRIGMKIAE